MRFALSLAASCLVAACAAAQQPTAPAWTYPELTTVPQQPQPLPPPALSPYHAEASGPIASGLPERTILVLDEPLPENGQQHWVAVNLCVLQPFAGRVEVKVWPRENNSVWIEAYLGSVLFDAMYGFGVRVQHTAKNFRNGDQLMISPGMGVHIIPNWYFQTATHVGHPNNGYSYYSYRYGYNSLYYLYGDVDISWLHDFSPHFGFELGLKVGLAGRLSGTVGRDYPNTVMWGKNLYPILSIFSGFRF